MYTKERFDPHDKKFAPQTERHHRKRYEFASTFPGKSYLDICSGQGYGADLLKKKHPEALVTGVEINPECIYQANKEYPDCHFYIDDITTSFASDKYDVVTFFEALEHITYKEGLVVLDYIYDEVLKPDGKLVVSTPRNVQDRYNHYHKSAWPFFLLKNTLGSTYRDLKIYGQSWQTGEINHEDVINNDFYICVCAK